MSTPTPRTEAMRIMVTDNDTCKIKVLETVHAAFARTLEREVIALTARAEKAEAELAKYLSACPASPTEEERKRCQQWWAISGKSP